jgi:hypothetical protein
LFAVAYLGKDSPPPEMDNYCDANSTFSKVSHTCEIVGLWSGFLFQQDLIREANEGSVEDGI